MKEQAIADGTTKYLKIEGMLSWEDNFRRTAKAFLGCVFYADNSNNRVGIPNRLFEYMYCGIPVVATDFPELRNIINKTCCGILVNSEDPKDIANAFEYLLLHPEEAQAMGARGKQAINTDYGFHIDLKRLEDFYKTIF